MFHTTIYVLIDRLVHTRVLYRKIKLKWTEKNIDIIIVFYV